MAWNVYAIGKPLAVKNELQSQFGKVGEDKTEAGFIGQVVNARLDTLIANAPATVVIVKVVETSTDKTANFTLSMETISGFLEETDAKPEVAEQPHSEAGPRSE